MRIFLLLLSLLLPDSCFHDADDNDADADVVYWAQDPDGSDGRRKNAISNAILIPHPVASLILHVLLFPPPLLHLILSGTHSFRHFPPLLPSPVPPFIHSFDLFHLVISSS